MNEDAASAGVDDNRCRCTTIGGAEDRHPKVMLSLSSTAANDAVASGGSVISITTPPGLLLPAATLMQSLPAPQHR
jgi:hypothetical protein